MSYLNLKYIDLSSITVVGSLIFFIWGIIVGLLLFIYAAINGNFDTLSLLIPFTIAFISLVGGVVYYFIGNFLYNIFFQIKYLVFPLKYRMEVLKESQFYLFQSL
ncbi:hypothetical protein [Methanobrevibacter arboriphilus]|uniref:hypothetical protein n=1 Tax=Methanobrevibacter arboriphilus TaxID=39441 RepID=UPI000B2FC1B3|nr:hypothetical protein [Methanobrevibacter arboriphilus]